MNVDFFKQFMQLEQEQQYEILQQFWRKYGKNNDCRFCGCLLVLFRLAALSKTAKFGERDSFRSLYQCDCALKAQPQDFIMAVEKFDSEVDHPEYSGLLHLHVAKIHVLHERYEDAAQMLQQLIGHPSQVLSNTAQLRLARVQAQMKHYEEALQTLEHITDPGYNAVAYELKGDIHMLQGDEELAARAYHFAATAAQSMYEGEGEAIALDEVLQMKVDDLAHISGEQQSAVEKDADMLATQTSEQSK